MPAVRKREEIGVDGTFELSTPSAGADEAFRCCVDTFLDASLTEPLRAAGRATTGLKSSPEACADWSRILRAQGWLAPSWPVAHGGAGWNTAQRLYFENACAARDAPIIQSSGIRTIGPLIIAEGSAAQQARYLPAILEGHHEWCQGFSEPQAGSDLSALTLRAELDGDEFILTGSKLWTSFAQYATHMFLLARCDPRSSGGEGLVFLLVEMNRPGIEVRPIRFLDGECETNEVFFKDARTPAGDRIGAIGDGWKTAKRLMAIARSNNTTTGQLRRALRAAWRESENSGVMDDGLRRHLAGLAQRVDEFESLEHHAASGRVSIDEGSTTSLLKLIATELHQLITQIGLETAPSSSFAQAKYLATRAATIYSGTSEVHRNILARAIGCP